MLTLLETLGPTERAVFVLREVFDFGYDEIVADGQVSGLYVMRNPAKLARLDEVVTLTR